VFAECGYQVIAQMLRLSCHDFPVIFILFILLMPRWAKLKLLLFL